MARRSPAQALLAPRVSALTEALPAALAGEVEGVHQARVASRRIREVLTVCRDGAGGRVAAARRPVRRITRALGPLRELDVCAQLFDEHVAAHVVDSSAAMAVRRSLAGARGAARRQTRHALTAIRLQKLWHDLDAAAGEAAGLAPATVFAAIDARVASRIARVREALGDAGTLYVPERLHAVRIAVKQLRYATELSGEAARARVSTRLAALRAVQDLLGRAHDLHVLGVRLSRVERRLVPRSRRTAGFVRDVGRALDVECRQLHAAFLSRRSALLSVCEALLARPAARRASPAA